jgi:hypothetical protein
MKNSIFAIILAALSLSSAHDLKGVDLSGNAAQISLKLTFGPGGDGDYPLYFQKVDAAHGTVTLCFLETETAFPLGGHAVDANPAVEEIFLKRLTSPSGKNFLGVELKMKEPPQAEAAVQPMPKGVLKVMLGKGGKGKLAWSLEKSLKAAPSRLAAPSQLADDAYLAAKAEAPPATATSKKGPHSAESPEAAPAAPVAAAPEQAAPETAPAPGATTPAASLKELKMVISKSQEDFLLAFDPPAVPAYAVAVKGADSSVLELAFDGAKSALERKEYAPPQSGLFKKVKITNEKGKLVLRFQLASKSPVQILPQEGALALTGAGKGESAVPSKWTTAKPDAVPAAAATGEAPDPVTSAHEEGAALDAAQGAGAAGRKNGLSSSGVFSLGKGGKSMIVTKDSAALKSAPGGKGKTLKKLPLGDKVEKLEKSGAWVKVVSGSDTGFFRADGAVYEDEITDAQAKDLQGKLAAKQAKADAAAQKQAAAEAKAQAKAEAARAKAAAVAAAAQPQAAEAQPQDVAEAAPVAVEGNAGVTKGLKPAKAPGAKGAAQAGPNLSLSANPELADKLAKEKQSAEEEKMDVEPEEKRIAYNSYGRRDPFIPVEQGAGDNGIDIDQMRVVGIIWQASEPMAVLEHTREAGVSFTVKAGDPVHNGRVRSISRDAVTFDISEYGISRSYSLKLISSKEGAKK